MTNLAGAGSSGSSLLGGGQSSFLQAHNRMTAGAGASSDYTNRMLQAQMLGLSESGLGGGGGGGLAMSMATAHQPQLPSNSTAQLYQQLMASGGGLGLGLGAASAGSLGLGMAQLRGAGGLDSLLYRYHLNSNTPDGLSGFPPPMTTGVGSLNASNDAAALRLRLLQQDALLGRSMGQQYLEGASSGVSMAGHVGATGIDTHATSAFRRDDATNEFLSSLMSDNGTSRLSPPTRPALSSEQVKQMLAMTSSTAAKASHSG